jgi:hypothetical protein
MYTVEKKEKRKAGGRQYQEHNMLKMFDTFHADLARNYLSPSVSVSYFHGNLC